MLDNMLVILIDTAVLVVSVALAGTIGIVTLMGMRHFFSPASDSSQPIGDQTPKNLRAG
jgi:hypothetical protein